MVYPALLPLMRTPRLPAVDWTVAPTGRFKWICPFVEASWNVVVHPQKPDFVFRRNARVHLNRWRRQFSRLLAAEVCASVVVMLVTPCSEVVWRVLATHSIRQFSPHFPPVRHRVPSHFNLSLVLIVLWICVLPKPALWSYNHHHITPSYFLLCHSSSSLPST